MLIRHTCVSSLLCQKIDSSFNGFEGFDRGYSYLFDKWTICYLRCDVLRIVKKKNKQLQFKRYSMIQLLFNSKLIKDIFTNYKNIIFQLQIIILNLFCILNDNSNIMLILIY